MSKNVDKVQIKTAIEVIKINKSIDKLVDKLTIYMSIQQKYLSTLANNINRIVPLKDILDRNIKSGVYKDQVLVLDETTVSKEVDTGIHPLSKGKMSYASEFNIAVSRLENAWGENYEEMKKYVQQVEENVIESLNSIETILQEVKDTCIECTSNVLKMAGEMEKVISKITENDNAIKIEHGVMSSLEEELLEALKNSFDISDNINELEPFLEEMIAEWLDIDDDLFSPYITFAKIALAISYKLGVEKAELQENVNELGETEGRKVSGTGVMDKAALYLYDTEKVDAEILQLQNEQLGTALTEWSNKQKLFQQETTAVNDKITQSYVEMFNGIREKVETYQTDMQNANDVVTQSYVKMFSDWGTSLATWWEEDVSPWFTAEKWQSLASGMQIGLLNKWLEIELWWDENGKLSEITVGIYNFLEAAMEKWKELIYWWENDKKGLDDLKLGIKIPKFKISFDAKDAYAEIFKLFGLKGTPIFCFEYKKYASGGFPEDGWFRASHGEYFGKFDDGTSYIANNRQITNGVASGVASAVRDANAEQNALLREQNILLRQILEKDTGISTRAVFEAVRAENRNFISRTGESAFAF